MNNIINLESFREITGGDPDIEKELFAEFVKGTDSQISLLENTWNDANRSQEWSSAGHTIKGNAMMLGAEALATMGKHAQFNPDEPAQTKKELLQQIITEYDRVKKAINAVHQ